MQTFCARVRPSQRLASQLQLTARLSLRRSVPWTIRLCATRPAGAKEQTVSGVVSQPPFPVRVLLVGSTVGLLTPVFATAGVITAWYRFLPRHGWGILLKYGLGAIVGGGIATLLIKWVLPFLQNHGDVVLPFAVANTVCSAFWYAVLESVLGLPAMGGLLPVGLQQALPEFLTNVLSSRLPIGGLAVGLCTAATTALLWPWMIKLCWSDHSQRIFLGPEKDAGFLVDLYYHTIPIGLSIGACAGLGLHHVLAPFLMGTVRGGLQHWSHTSGAALVGITSLGVLYFGISRTIADDFYWTPRYDPKTGAVYSWNTRTEQSSPTPNNAVMSENKRQARVLFHVLRQPLKVLFGWQLSQKKGLLSEIQAPEAFRTGRDIDFEDVHDYSHTLQLIDHLLRLKYLQIEEQKTGRNNADHIAKVTSACEKTFGLDAERLLEDVCAVAACKASLEAVDRSAPDAEAKLAWFRELMNRAETKSKRSVIDKNSEKLLERFLVNHVLFEKELFDRVGYRVPRLEYVQRVQAERRKEKQRTTMWYIGIPFLLAAGLAAVVSSTESGRGGS